MAALAPHAGILAASGEIVTATPRQARGLQAALGRAEARRGRSVWASPRVTPYHAWLAARVRPLDDRPELLDAVVERRLWLQVVADSAPGARLLNPHAAAAEAARAWALAHDWRLPLASAGATGPDEAAFAERLRHVLGHPDEAAEVGRRGREAALEFFDFRASSRRIGALTPPTLTAE